MVRFKPDPGPSWSSSPDQRTSTAAFSVISHVRPSSCTATIMIRTKRRWTKERRETERFLFQRNPFPFFSLLMFLISIVIVPPVFGAMYDVIAAHPAQPQSTQSSLSSHQLVAPAGCEWRPRWTATSAPHAGNGAIGGMLAAPRRETTHLALATTSSSSSSDQFILQCQLRTLNGPLDSGVNLNLIPTDRTYAVRLLCEDVLFPSSLPSRAFERLHQLRELYIERCKLSELPADVFAGLQELRHLAIRTGNTEWGDLSLKMSAPTVSSQSSSSVFAAVKRLESLDLSENGLSQLPPGLFCPLPRLQFLNLSSNAISEVASLGFRAKSADPATTTGTDEQGVCRLLDSIVHLDASHNRIKVLTDRGFSRLPRLQVLNLRHNLIVRAEETSLAGLAELTRLDLSNNQLVALPARFFQAVKSTLVELDLRNNSISVIPPGLFSGLAQVTVLDLSNNEVTSHWIGPTTFADMARLLSLDLSHNKLSRIDANAFRALFTLQSLSLQHNEIESLAENAFIANRNLHTLSLSGNRLTALDATSFAGLEVLNALLLDGNRLQHVHGTAFANITGLMELNLGQNRLETVPPAIQTLHGLRSLDLSHNRINDISNASYQGLEQLYSLNLEANLIGNLSRGDFIDLPGLRVLNLAGNRIAAVEQGTFDNIPDLHALRLDSNTVADINGLFVNLRDLLMLNISVNRIAMFDYAMIPVGLQWLDLHENLVENLGNYFEIETELKLRTLDASRNRLVEIEPGSLPDSIEVVLLNRNLIRKVAPLTFLKKENLTRADLSDNRLTSLDLNALRLSKVPSRRPLPEFSVGGNPFICDCHMEWLQRAAAPDDPTANVQERQYPRVVDAHLVQCRLAFGRQSSNVAIGGTVPLLAVRPSQFLCTYRSHCFALCHCCEFDACDCEMTCPDNCSCFYDQSWNANIVDCGGHNHWQVPGRIPMDVTDLYLDGNQIGELSPHTFIGRKNLRHLYLNQSHIHTINNRTFNGLKSLLLLNLADNQLETLHGYEFERLSELRELYLQRNQISTIANRTFQALRSLQVLRLDYNRIVEFELWSAVAAMPALNELYIGFNAWSCDCHFVAAMLEWLPQRHAMVRDLSYVQCQYNETYFLPLGAVALGYPTPADANLTVACSAYAKRESITAPSSSSSSSSSGSSQLEMLVPILVLIVVSTFGVLLLLASIVTAVLYRHEISVWLYARTGIRMGGHAGGKKKPGGRRGDHYDADSGEKLFDAFVSYAKKDEQFVQQMLAPELEYGNTPMRLCLHYRDLPVASGFVADAIIEAMAASRRTILVISEHFLRGEWQHFEFRSAHQEALRSRARHKLILIFVGPVAGKDLDPDIRMWLKTAGNTCLQWGEKMFWEKLRYAMPEIPASSGGGSSSGVNSSSSSSTTSSLYGRKAALQHQQQQQQLNHKTLPLNLGPMNRNPLTDAYHQHLQPGHGPLHPLLPPNHLTLGRGYHQQAGLIEPPQLYSPSSVHSQQSTYAYPSYHPAVPPPTVPPPPLPMGQHGGAQATPPPLPPSHPLHGRGMFLPSSQTSAQHHLHSGGGIRAANSSNDSSLMTNNNNNHSGNSSDLSNPSSTVPFVPSASSTTAVAVHI